MSHEQSIQPCQIELKVRTFYRDAHQQTGAASEHTERVADVRSAVCLMLKTSS